MCSRRIVGQVGKGDQFSTSRSVDRTSSPPSLGDQTCIKWRKGRSDKAWLGREFSGGPKNFGTEFEEGRAQLQVQRLTAQPLVEVEERRALDLFSGTGSVARVLEEAGFEVTTLDNDPRYEAELIIDILDWDYRRFPVGYFELIAASPPCTEFSRAKTVGHQNLEGALEVVQRTLKSCVISKQSGGWRHRAMGFWQSIPSWQEFFGWIWIVVVFKIWDSRSKHEFSEAKSWQSCNHNCVRVVNVQAS